MATPTQRGLEVPHVASLLALYTQLVMMGARVNWFCTSIAPVSLARDWIVSHVLQNDYDRLVMLDADLGFEAHHVVKLLELPHEFSCIAYRKKHQDTSRHDYAVYLSDDLQTPASDGTIAIESVGAGCMVLQTRALRDMVEYYRALSYTEPYGAKDAKRVLSGVFREDYTEGTFVSEDFAFCRRWRAMGKEIRCLVDSPTVHEGMLQWKGNMKDPWDLFHAKALEDAAKAAEDAATKVEGLRSSEGKAG